MMKIILAVDPGEKNIGIAKSDPLGIGATPICVIPHVQQEKDAQAIADKASSGSLSTRTVPNGPRPAIPQSSRKQSAAILKERSFSTMNTEARRRPVNGSGRWVSAALTGSGTWMQTPLQRSCSGTWMT